MHDAASISDPIIVQSPGRVQYPHPIINQGTEEQSSSRSVHSVGHSSECDLQWTFPSTAATDSTLVTETSPSPSVIHKTGDSSRQPMEEKDEVKLNPVFRKQHVNPAFIDANGKSERYSENAKYSKKVQAHHARIKGAAVSTNLDHSSTDEKMYRAQEVDVFESVRPLIEAIQSRMTTIGKAPACDVQSSLLEIEPHLFQSKPRIKTLGHYLMHMRSKGAPVRFDASRGGVTWIYLV